MSQTKRELVRAALNGETVDRVPVGFWFHFLSGEDAADAFAEPGLHQQNIEGHRKFYEEFQPDFVKLMSDGYFIYPHPAFSTISSVSQFGAIEPLGKNHPWILQQVRLVQQLQEIFADEVYTFYNIFAPARVLEWSLAGFYQELPGDWIAEDKAAFKRGLAVIAEDISSLVAAVLSAGGADGIYFSVQNIADPRIDQALYQDVFAPGEKKILQSANAVKNNTILHICGYEGHHNDLTWYQSYEAKAVNWAAVVENISLAEGKQLFPGKTLLGGFGNTTEDLLYYGSEAEIKAETKKILRAAGKEGIILGADCTVPRDISLDHLDWVREAASEVK